MLFFYLTYLLCFFQEALAPRSARNIKSYAEADPSERSNKRKKKEPEPPEPPERVQKRRKAEYSAPAVPMVDGASVQVRSWSYGNLSKRDALRFSRAVRSYYFPQFLVLHFYKNPIAFGRPNV
jgi:chromodomain-helicase-DNA-binding protein 1